MENLPFITRNSKTGAVSYWAPACVADGESRNALGRAYGRRLAEYVAETGDAATLRAVCREAGAADCAVAAGLFAGLAGAIAARA